MRCRVNGPGHYVEAERLLALSAEQTEWRASDYLVASAHVHAQLALIALTAQGGNDLNTYSGGVVRGTS